MEYTVSKLSEMSGVSTRTLRYYDEIGILKPKRINSSGYRIYGRREVDMLQQILFYREMGVPLENIKSIISGPDFDRESALHEHLTSLLEKRKRIDTLIRNVKITINALKGAEIMSDNEKFQGFKEKMIEENEKKYGGEIREKYGDKAVDDSNKKVMGMTEEEYNESERLRLEVNELLKAAFEAGDPAGELAQKACRAHKDWLCFFYDKYSKEYHKGLGDMYVADERFSAYYDAIKPGCAAFLRDAIYVFCR